MMRMEERTHGGVRGKKIKTREVAIVVVECWALLFFLWTVGWVSSLSGPELTRCAMDQKFKFKRNENDQKPHFIVIGFLLSLHSCLLLWHGRFLVYGDHNSEINIFDRFFFINADKFLIFNMLRWLLKTVVFLLLFLRNNWLTSSLNLLEGIWIWALKFD